MSPTGPRASDTPGVIGQRPLGSVLRRMRLAATERLLARLAGRHRADGLPDLAVPAFDHVGRQVVVWGRYEREELALLLRCAAPHLVGRGGVCLDVGANVGNHALAFAPHFHRVLAFEPHPRTAALLRANAMLAANVEVLELALSDHDGRALLAAPAGNAGMAKLQGEGASSGTPVALRRLDGLAQLTAQRVAMIKIDVEGHEAAVLRGGAELLRRDRPVVVFEQTPDGIGDDGDCEPLRLLREAGYAEFWTLEQLPREGRSRWLNRLRRLLLGDTLRLVRVQRLQRRFHAMVVALPGPR